MFHIANSLGIHNPMEFADNFKREKRFENEPYYKKLKQVKKDFYNDKLSEEDELFYKEHSTDISYVEI